MPSDDIWVLSLENQSAAVAAGNGELVWSVQQAPYVLEELAAAGRVVLGIDIRDYDDSGAFLETPWSVYEGADPLEALNAALAALGRPDLPGKWALITWGP